MASRRKEGTEVAQWLNSIGVAGIVLKYRVPARRGPRADQGALCQTRSVASG